MFPEAFISILTESLGSEAAAAVEAGLSKEPSVSVRCNPAKLTPSELRDHFADNADSAVEWAPEGLYLKERPSFTLDPLFHAGAYYVQEASSMYVGRLLEKAFPNISTEELRILDLCAAPGGKTTQILSLISGDSILVSNEVMRQRASILAENSSKWGRPNSIVTTNDPADFKDFDSYFDAIVIDAPCSGEGMFRKDDEAVAEWSPDNVNLCAARQRRIVADIWDALRPGGFAIYSTCTFNHFEDEDNASWICSELGGELIEQRHFLPGRDRGEGFYCALIRKSADAASGRSRIRRGLPYKGSTASLKGIITEDCLMIMKNSKDGDLVKAYPRKLAAEMREIEQHLHVIHSGIAVATVKGKDYIPEADLALSTIFNKDWCPQVNLTKQDALKFLAKEPLLFPDQPKGYLAISYEGRILGFVKNLGSRSNNLLPPSRRIRMQI